MILTPGTYVPVGGMFAPTDPNTDTYAILDAFFMKDGLRNVATTAERNAITAARRRAGMIVGVGGVGINDTFVYYRLKNRTWTYNDDDWETWGNGNVGGDSGILNFVPEGITVEVKVNYQYLIYGNLTVEGVIDNNGEIVIINGNLILQNNGVFNNIDNGIVKFIELVQPPIATGIEWQNSALSYIIDNTTPPPTEVAGDRYILSTDGGIPHVDYDGALAGDIVEFNGTGWSALTPRVGTFISADDSPNFVYYYGGSSWTQKAWENTQSGLGVTVGGSGSYKVDLDIATVTSGSVVDASADDLTIRDNSETGNETRKVTVDAFVAGIIDTTDNIVTQDVTTKKIKIAEATDLQKGVVVLASTVETKTGTDTTKVINPADIASFLRVKQVTISTWAGAAPNYTKVLTAGESLGDYDLGSNISDIISVKTYVAGIEVSMEIDRSVAGQITISSTDNPTTIVEILGKGYTA